MATSGATAPSYAPLPIACRVTRVKRGTGPCGALQPKPGKHPGSARASDTLGTASSRFLPIFVTRTNGQAFRQKVRAAHYEAPWIMLYRLYGLRWLRWCCRWLRRRQLPCHQVVYRICTAATIAATSRMFSAHRISSADLPSRRSDSRRITDAA